ncbi:hypothetical protein [Kitasatospora sp. NPDC056184]|uniref:hypothetical protein n=1 Tax=Kitasatospora sp. NPDC056184 TaxID=3345738 RepID=UPI0035D95570
MLVDDDAGVPHPVGGVRRASLGVDEVSFPQAEGGYVLATRARRELHFCYEGNAEPAALSSVGTALLLRG